MERSCTSLSLSSDLQAKLAHGLPGQMDRCSTHGVAICHTAAQLSSLLPFVLVVPLAISTPCFPHSGHSCELLFPQSLSHQEGQGVKVLSQIVTQEKSQCAHVSYIIFTLSLPFFSMNSNHPPTAVHLGFSHDSGQIWADTSTTGGNLAQMLYKSKAKLGSAEQTGRKLHANQLRPAWEVSPN